MIERQLSQTCLVAACLGLTALFSGSANALNFSFGDVDASLGVLLSAGATWRAEDRDYSLISKRSHPSQHGLGVGEEVLCADDQTGGDPSAQNGIPLIGDLLSEDLLGGCVLSGREHRQFVLAPGSYSQNRDQGNLNYDKGDVVHTALKATIDLDLAWGDFGLFARGISFWDPTAEDYEETHFDAIHQRPLTARSQAAEDEIGLSVELEDFYAYGSFDVLDRTLSINVGKQKISWGESLTFAVNSINSFNAPSLVRLHTPGFDLKELFIPTSAVLAGIDLTENTALEAFYQLDWNPVQLPPIGAYYSTSDVAGTGQGYAMLGFGREPEDPGNIQDQYVASTDPDSDHVAALGRGCVNDGTNFGDDVGIYQRQNRVAFGDADNPASQIPDRLAEFGFYQAEREGEEAAGRTICLADSKEPDADGQWGLKFSYYAEWLNDTEFGFYFMNYHSRLPIASFIASDINDDAGQEGLHALLSPIFNIGAQNDGSLEEDDADILGALKRVDTAAVFLEYPEDIQMYGVSFNTTFGDLSVSGEMAYRPNLPSQIATVDLTLAALAPAFNQARDAAGPTYVEAYRYGPQLGQNQRVGTAQERDQYQQAIANGASAYDAYWGLNNGRGPSGAYVSNRSNAEGETRIGTSNIIAGQIIQGYEELEVVNASVTMLYSTGQNPFGADQWTLIGDFGTTQVLNMPSLDELQFAAPGDDNWYGVSRDELDANAVGNGGTACQEVDNAVLNLAGLGSGATLIDTLTGVIGGLLNQNQSLINTNCVPGVLRQTPVSEDGSTFATASSWGFRVLSFLKYNNLIFGANLNQLFGVFVDVNGNSPGPGGNFVEGRKRFVWGSEFTRGDWTMNFNYNWYTGAGDRNDLNDRDTFGMDVRYSF